MVALGALADSNSVGSTPEYVFDTKRIVARGQGREGCPREARRQLDEHRFEHPQPVPRLRSERLLIAAERLEEDLEAERRAASGERRGLSDYKTHGRMGAWAHGRMDARPLTMKPSR